MARREMDEMARTRGEMAGRGGLARRGGGVGASLWWRARGCRCSSGCKGGLQHRRAEVDEDDEPLEV